MNNLRPRIHEIDFDEIELQQNQVLGKGTFGTVKKARWRNHEVAVKLIETEQEKNALNVEILQLSRANHPNIVKIFGACTKNQICLVMEYADCGSLHNLLHQMPHVQYTASQGISWALQCARGVAYLHTMDEKPLIHRDLKPLNLLLFNHCTVVKLCDFGTACDVRTIMTTPRGSAYWMAPEVIAGSQYCEKCDVFSWAVIFWEILTRRIPFNKQCSYQVMWAVAAGSRPPPIQNCPKPLENLMTSCWAQDPMDRPSMSEVERDLSMVARFFPGGDEPIHFPPPPPPPEQESEASCMSSEVPSSLPESSVNFVGTDPTSSSSIGAASVKPKALGHRRSHSASGAATTSTSKSNMEYLALEPDLQPVLPASYCPESLKIFQDHRQLAADYLWVHTEMDLLTTRKLELIKEAEKRKASDLEEYNRLLLERASLQNLVINLRRRLADSSVVNPTDDDWEVVM